MKKLKLFAIGFVAAVFISSCSQKESIVPEPASNESEAVVLKSASLKNKYIVVLKSDFDISRSDLKARNGKVNQKALGLLKKYDIPGEPEEIYETAIQGFTARLEAGQLKKLEADSNVKYIEADQEMSISQEIVAKGKPVPPPPPPAPDQTIPWGISRVGGGTLASSHTAWVIDTGVDFSHPDLNADESRSETFLRGKRVLQDENGHGTHVAGTIAALNNAIGVVGVAPGTTVVSVRVLDRSGSGSNSGVIAGVNYVAANGVAGDVANMSLGGGISQALDDAVVAASSVVKFVLAAGNDGINANNSSPARANGPNIYTISAMDINNNFAYFSNYGNPPVDYCAPGVNILSTYLNGSYSTLSGTSMAAPHVAGILLLGPVNSTSTVNGDKDATPDPIAKR